MSEDPVLQHLLPQLGVEEKRTSYVYDDVTGKQFVKGMTLQGNLTAAIGVNLSDGLDPEEVIWLSTHRANKVLVKLAAFQWYLYLDTVRQAAVADIAFNLGISGLLHWPHFLSCLAEKDYAGANEEIVGNQVWINQVHKERAGRIEGMILTGQWPGDIRV